jgi:hypothetical protein
MSRTNELTDVNGMSKISIPGPRFVVQQVRRHEGTEEQELGREERPHPELAVVEPHRGLVGDRGHIRLLSRAVALARPFVRRSCSGSFSA